ncbi:response regulator [Nocardioides sp.]|uniref:response regulator n=1 Tax=Nocardioides sp. TaxID=35761 RepID=UPI002719D195|nr:response regulator [Nocardioides sp.]MDO9454518.1 response regulator [Nocardioides sp.]
MTTPDSAPLRQILLVEDSLSDIEITLEALAEASVASNVVVVRDGDAALEHLRAPRVSHPHLVILDLNLPRLSGHEVLAAMRADPELRMIPVVVLTTSAAESDVLKTYDLGANCFLTKPFGVDQFIDVVRSIDGSWLNLARLPR